MDTPSRSRSNLFLPLAVLLVGTVQAAPFNENVKAPTIATEQEFANRLKAHFDTFQRKRAEQPGAFVRDQAARKRWSDLHFSITHAMDEARPLRNLAAFGLVANDDGTYTVDLQKFPQWAPLDSRLYVLSNPNVLESAVPALVARGFRDADIASLRTYVATHDAQQATLAEGKQLVATFAGRLQQRQQAGHPLAMQEVLAYRYQRTMVRREAERQWAIGLLDVLDNQRQRVLASWLEEQQASTTFGKPLQTLNRTLEVEAAPLISGAYVQLIEQNEVALKKSAQQRAQTLLGGSLQ